MSSLDMDAYFGKVANSSRPQAAHADHMTGHPHASELLDHSESFQQFSQSIPDPFAEGYTHAELDRVLAKSGQTPPKVGRVQSKSGKGLAKSGQTMPMPDSNQVNSGRGISKSDQTHARIGTSSRHPVMREVSKVDQGSWNSDDCQGLTEMTASHTGTDMPDLQLGSLRQSKLLDAASNTVEAAPSSMTVSHSKADARDSMAAMNSHGLEQAQQQQQQQAACVREPEFALHHSTPAGIPAGTQQTAAAAAAATASAATDTGKAGTRPSAVQGAWPLMPHVTKLRHGQQLRQAAAEAAAVAAGQAAKAESAVPLRTPPTIAFNSKAARHAMAAAEAAAAAASLTGGQVMHAVTGGQEEPNQGCSGQGLRAGRLHASAPASTMNAGKQGSSVFHQACHGLSAAVGRRTDCISDVVVVGAPQYVGGPVCKGQLHNTAWQSCSAGGMTGSASAPNSPQPVKHAAGVESHRAAFAQSQQSGVPHHKALQQPLDVTAQQAKSLSEGQVTSGSDPQLGGHSSQNQGWQHDKEEEQSPPEAQQWFQHESKLGSHLASTWQQQQEEEQRMPPEVQQGCKGGSQLGSRWQQQEGEDPFKASAMFPVYAELAGSSNASGSSPLTDCTNQLARTGIHSHQHALVQHTFAQSRHRRHASKSAADVSKVADTALALHQASAKGRHTYSGQQACGSVPAAEPMPAQRLTCSASDAAAALTSLSEEDFWQAARADLMDTAETVKHKSRLCDALLKSSTPVRLHQMKALSGSIAQTPKPGMREAHYSGITPLLGMLIPACSSKQSLL